MSQASGCGSHDRIVRWQSPSGRFVLESADRSVIYLKADGKSVAFEWGDPVFALFGELLERNLTPEITGAKRPVD